MGMYHSTYFAYGVHVDASPYAEAERLEEEIPKHKDQLPDVGFLMAGHYDDDRLFLTTQCTEVRLGKWEHVTPQSETGVQLADWNRQLAAAVEALGYGDRAVSAPGWLCIPDLS
jgi:hypothetical protein